MMNFFVLFVRRVYEEAMNVFCVEDLYFVRALFFYQVRAPIIEARTNAWCVPSSSHLILLHLFVD